MATTQPRIVRADDGPRFDVLGVGHMVSIAGNNSGGQLAVVELYIPPGAGIPPHLHTREDETFYVLEGSVDFTIAGQEVLATPGVTIFAPRKLPHGFKAVGPSAARVLVIICPAGIEAMFAELAALPAGPPEMSRLSQIVGRYGITFA